LGIHLECADLRHRAITQAQLDTAIGDERTQIPDHLTRPAHWTKPPSDDDAAPDHDLDPPA